MRTLSKVLVGIACLAVAYAALYYQVKHDPYRLMSVAAGDHMRQTVDPKSFFKLPTGVFCVGCVAGFVTLGVQFDKLFDRYRVKI